MTTEKEAKKYCFTITEERDVVNATYVTRMFAEELKFSIVMQTMIATAVSELAMNVVKYAGRGWITVGVIRQMDQIGIEVIAEDRGPGIADRIKALTDHVSTGGTLGIGLPSVKRLMDEFLIDTDKNYGTKIVVRKWRPA